MLQLTAIGHLGQDATLNTANGKSVVNFRIAHSDKFKDAEGVLNEKTIWISCSYWDGEKVAPFLKTGTQVFLQGQPSINLYNSKQTGEAQSELKLTVFRLELLGGKRDEVKNAS